MKDLNARKTPLQINNPYATEDAAITGMRVAPTTAAGQSSSPMSTTPFSHQVSHGSSAATVELPPPKRPAPSPPGQEQRTEFSKKMQELEQLESNERHSLRYSTDLHRAKSFANFGYEFQQLYRRIFQCGQDLSLESPKPKDQEKIQAKEPKVHAEMEHRCYEQRMSGLYEGLEKSLRELKDMVTALRQRADCGTNPFALFRPRRSRLPKHAQSEDSPKQAQWNLPKHAQSEDSPKKAQWNLPKHAQSEDSPKQAQWNLPKHAQSEDSPKKAQWNLPKHAQSEISPKQAQWNGPKHIQSEDSPKKAQWNLPKHSQTEDLSRPAQWSWLKRGQREESKRIQESVQQPGEEGYVPTRSQKRGKRSGQAVRRRQAASRFWELLEAMTASYKLRRGHDVRRTTLMCPTRESWGQVVRNKDKEDATNPFLV